MDNTELIAALTVLQDLLPRYNLRRVAMFNNGEGVNASIILQTNEGIANDGGMMFFKNGPAKAIEELESCIAEGNFLETMY